MPAPREIWLIRHGETIWSLSGAHTSHTDLPLTEHGREAAAAMGRALAGHRFALVLTSPLARARESCDLAGFGARAVIDPNLRELDYGDYEGRTTAEIWNERPGWNLWRDGCPNGESLADAAARADATIARALEAEGDALLFGHGHILRILAARWLGLEPSAARLLAFSTASFSVLGYEREQRVLSHWNVAAG